jgi:hypothetical protein
VTVHFGNVILNRGEAVVKDLTRDYASVMSRRTNLLPTPKFVARLPHLRLMLT